MGGLVLSRTGGGARSRGYKRRERETHTERESRFVSPSSLLRESSDLSTFRPPDLPAGRPWTSLL
jgi:hypothetical protein